MSRRELPSLELETAEEWHAWLERNHTISPGVWLRFKRKGVPSRTFTRVQAWEEALCYGWIDSLMRTTDEDTFAQKYTPRKKGSAWSETNLKKVEELERQGRMRECGRAVVDIGAIRKGSERPSELSSEIERMVRENDRAWHTFQALSPGERRDYVHWIMEAKREETRARRAKEAIVRLAAGKRLGLK